MAQDFKNIRAAIVAKINTMTTPGICYGYDKSIFDELPAVIVIPSGNESDYSDTDRDRVTFVFRVRAYYDVTGEGNYDEAEVALEGVVDELLTEFREKDALPGVTDWVIPAPSAWEYEVRDDKVYRVAEITLKCVKHIARNVG